MSNKWQRWQGIMKAVPFEEKRLAKWTPPYIIQPKYDGDRCRAIPCGEGNFILLTSEENVFYSVPHINEALAKSGLDNIELDGELYSHELHKEGGHELIHSIASRTVHLHPRHEELQFHIFDIVEEKQQVERILKLRDIEDDLPPKWNTPLQFTPYYACNSLDQIMKVYYDILNNGYEGIIVRNLNALYVRKRSTWVMKFKPKKEDVYEIIGWKEEYDISGNPKGCLGALQCKSGDGNIFNVGTGFTEHQRMGLWKVKEELPGKNLRVQYQHLTSGKKVPRFPVFVEVINGT